MLCNILHITCYKLTMHYRYMIFAHEQKNAVDPDPNYGRPLLYGVRRQKNV